MYRLRYVHVSVLLCFHVVILLAPLKRKCRQVDDPDVHWRRWRQASTSPANTKVVILTTFPFRHESGWVLWSIYPYSSGLLPVKGSWRIWTKSKRKPCTQFWGCTVYIDMNLCNINTYRWYYIWYHISYFSHGMSLYFIVQIEENIRIYQFKFKSV